MHLGGVLSGHLDGPGQLDGVLPGHLSGYLDGLLPGHQSEYGGLPRYMDGHLVYIPNVEANTHPDAH